MWFEKGEKNIRQKVDSNPGRSHQNKYIKQFTICATRADNFWLSFVMLSNLITYRWADVGEIASTNKAGYLHLV